MRRTEIIFIEDSATGLPQSAELITGVTFSEMASADSQWQPFLVQAVMDALLRGVPRYDLPENKHWEWERKARATGKESVAFAIAAQNEIQSLMISRTDKLCRIPSQRGQPLIYIDYLASAPWNLSGLVVKPRFVRCGVSLVVAAMRHSAALGFGGRIGLHALQGAEGFYRDKIQMADLGIDIACDNLRYFEMTDAGATAFLGKATI